jgi:hypothetical protein
VTELERSLIVLGEELDWPVTPDLSLRVRRSIAPAPRPRSIAPAPRRRRRLAFRRSFAIALAALLVLAAGVLAAVPGVRDPVLEFFGLQGATVERREVLPPVPERRPLDLGRRTTLAAAGGAVRFEPLVPQAAGRPDGVFVSDAVPGGELSLAYRARDGLPEARSTRLGLLVSEFRGDLAPEYTAKIAGQATVVERLRVDGARAVWLAGAPHFFFYRSAQRPITERELRIAQNVLLVEQGDLLVRLEGAFGRERAIELARSLR